MMRIGTAVMIVAALAGTAARAAADTCGNGIVEGSEQCDDDNTTDGDGCSSTCTIEDGWACQAFMFATGTDVMGNAITDAPEQHWTWALGSDRVGEQPGYDGQNGAWSTPPNGQWVTPDTEFGDDLTSQAYTYWFQDVTMPAAVAGTLGLTVLVGADNEAEVFVNGVSQNPDSIVVGFNSFTSIDIPAGAFIAGLNTIMVALHEDGPGSPRGLMIFPGGELVLSQCTRLCTDATVCDDGDECTDDACGSNGGCTHAAEAPGTPCTGGTCGFIAPVACVIACGDGVRGGGEQCDDGNRVAGDGCSTDCTIEPGYTCAGETPDVCTATCGDGILAASEGCDDGNTVAGDGCSSTCMVEPGYGCQGAVGSKSACAGICGDGLVVSDEQCDDGSANGTRASFGSNGSNGCSVSCTLVPSNTFDDGLGAAGGGCATSGGSSGAALIVLGVGLALGRRRHGARS